MANRELFRSTRGTLVAATNAVNEQGAPAYAFSEKHALAQYAATGCLSGTFYATGAEQLEKVLSLAALLDSEFVAKTAVFTRERGYMKDTPALLLAVLATRDGDWLERAFSRVVDNGRMLRNFVQIVRSGVTGRKSLGSRPKRLVREWLDRESDRGILAASVGKNPSLADVIRMVHPKPKSETRRALYGWLIGREVERSALPENVRDLIAYRAGLRAELPTVPFLMLTSLPIGRAEWVKIAERASWHQTRMNLNTFARHGVFLSEAPGAMKRIRRLVRGKGPEVTPLTRVIAGRLRDARAIRKARVFPYQLMTARNFLDPRVPKAIRQALEDAMEVAIENVPTVGGRVFVCPDVSGSMTWSALTGQRPGATSVVRCIDVAALVAAAMLRRNRNALVLPFAGELKHTSLDPRASVAINAAKLAALGGGATQCSAPVRWLNRKGMTGDLILFVSDNESWVDPRDGRGTALMHEWEEFKKRSPNAKLVCLDIQPYGTSQAVEREDILNIGGFSDRVFDVIADFAAGRLGDGHWVGEIEKVEL